MPFAPGTPYRNPYASHNANSEEGECSPTSKNFTKQARSEIPTSLMAGAVQAAENVDDNGEQETEMGDLYNRRKSRMSGIETPQQATQHRQSWFDKSADLPLRTYDPEQAMGSGMDMRQGEVNVKRPDEAHIRPPPTSRTEQFGSSEMGERDLEAGVWLTRREKKEWAILILAGSLSVCALCGLIAGLAVT